MPAFMYGRNRGEEEIIPNSKLFPRLKPGEVNIPYSPYWMVCSDRLSHPVSIMFADGHIRGISGSPYLVKENNEQKMWEPKTNGEWIGFNGFSCSLDNESSVGYTIGYEQAPVNYIDLDIVKERTCSRNNCICLGVGEELSFPVYVYDFYAEEETGINDVIQDVYWRYHQMPRNGASFSETVRDISSAIYEDAFMDTEFNYATMLNLNHNEVEKQPHTSISWTGGVEIATPLLLTSLRLENENMRNQALSCIQNIVDHSLNSKSGLPFDSCLEGKWTTSGWWENCLEHKGHSSYLVGQALYYIIKAYDYEDRSRGIQHTDWMDFVSKVVENIETTKNDQEEYPYIFSAEDGQGIEYDSFAGCWCLAARSYLAKLKEDKEMLRSCVASELHYYENYVKKMECYGTPHDAYKAVDSEGILAFIRVVRILHEELQEEEYLTQLKNALEYEFSFKFCYNVPILAQPLSHLSWSSSGGSVTSTANPHIHPMSSSVMDEILYYVTIHSPS